jgi:hypothetical protein
MKGRVAKVRLTLEQLLRLQDGLTLNIRLPKDVALLRISLYDGDIFARFDRFFEKFGILWDDFWKPRK